MDSISVAVELKGVGKNVCKSEAVRRPPWLIVNYDDLYLQVFTIGSRGGQALAVFGSEEDAETFLDSRLGSSGQRWRVRQTSVGELISVLYGPCSDVKRVTLDPLAEEGGEALLGVLSMDRKDFLRDLLGGGPSELASLRWRRPGKTIPSLSTIM